MLGSQAGREHPPEEEWQACISGVGNSGVVHSKQPSCLLMLCGRGLTALDLACICVLPCSSWYTRAGMKEVPDIPGPLWTAQHGDSPDLIQPKLTLFSSGLLGLPEWELLRPNNPFWAPGTFLPLQTGESLVYESPCTGTVSPPPGSQFHFERSVVHFVLSSSILGRRSLRGSQAPLRP